MDHYARKKDAWDVSRKKLDQLIDLHRSRCFYCNLPVIRIRTIQRLGLVILENRGNTVTFRIGPLTVRYPVATVDHVRPVSKHSYSELVLACWYCNNQKSAKPRITWKEPADLKPQRV
jgi:5-methylcytosine-specific restriction endonuclease McrA